MAIWQSAVEGVVLNPSFWSGKRILLTGHTGFKGSWLSLWLQSMGAHVVGYALAPTTIPSLFEVAEVGKGMISIIGDVRDISKLQTVFAEHRPEIVFHMAAQPLVRYSYQNPVETYTTNVMGTVYLLEAVRNTPSVKSVVNITTDKCYENREWIWGYRENEPMGGCDPYSSSKGCAELVTSAYRRSYFSTTESDDEPGVALASARAGNAIGGGDWADDRLIPDLMRSISAGKPVCIRNPKAIRPWQHVLEPLNGYLTLAEKLYTIGVPFAQAFNFGPAEEDAKTVQWIVEQLSKHWGNSANWTLDQAIRPHEANYLKLDCSKAHSLLNWRPKWDLEMALSAIVCWQKAYLSGADMRATTEAQIAFYQKSNKRLNNIGF